MSTTQIVGRLEKFSLGRPDTDYHREYYEELLSRKQPCDPSITWQQYSDISIPAPKSTLLLTVGDDGTRTGVVQAHYQKSMTPSDANACSFYDTTMTNCVMANVDKTYEPLVYTSTGTFIAAATYLIDYSSGIITFYATVSGVSYVNPPKITYYQYVGNLGSGGITTMLITYVHNFTGADISKLVYYNSGASDPNKYAIATNTTQEIIGVLKSISDSSHFTVLISGKYTTVPDLPSATGPIYTSSAGTITTTTPVDGYFNVIGYSIDTARFISKNILESTPALSLSIAKRDSSANLTVAYGFTFSTPSGYFNYSNNSIYISGISSSFMPRSVIIGDLASSGAAGFADSVHIGYKAAYGNLDITGRNVILGSEAVKSGTTLGDIVASGYQALVSCTGGNIISLGSLSGSNSGSGLDNIFLGKSTVLPSANASGFFIVGIPKITPESFMIGDMTNDTLALGIGSTTYSLSGNHWLMTLKSTSITGHTPADCLAYYHDGVNSMFLRTTYVPTTDITGVLGTVHYSGSATAPYPAAYGEIQYVDSSGMNLFSTSKFTYDTPTEAIQLNTGRIGFYIGSDTIHTDSITISTPITGVITRGIILNTYGMPNITTTTSDIIAIGYKSGAVLGNSATTTLLIGSYAGDLITTATSCLLIGHNAGSGITTSGNNLGTGHGCMDTLISGSYNTAYGNLSCMTATTSDSVFGYGAGNAIVSYDSIFGYLAGLTVGSYSSIYGDEAATYVGDYCTILGYRAAYTSTIYRMAYQHNIFIGSSAGTYTPITNDTRQYCTIIGESITSPLNADYWLVLGHKYSATDHILLAGNYDTDNLMICPGADVYSSYGIPSGTKGALIFPQASVAVAPTSIATDATTAILTVSTGRVRLTNSKIITKKFLTEGDGLFTSDSHSATGITNTSYTLFSVGLAAWTGFLGDLEFNIILTNGSTYVYSYMCTANCVARMNATTATGEIIATSTLTDSTGTIPTITLTLLCTASSPTISFGIQVQSSSAANIQYGYILKNNSRIGSVNGITITFTD